MGDDRAEEVRISLQTSREMPLPVVAVVPEAALTLNRAPRDVQWELGPEADLTADCNLDLVFEPPPLEELLEAGRRHTLPEESITLHPATPSPPRSCDSPLGDGPRSEAQVVGEAFGAPSPSSAL